MDYAECLRRASIHSVDQPIRKTHTEADQRKHEVVRHRREKVIIGVLHRQSIDQRP